MSCLGGFHPNENILQPKAISETEEHDLEQLIAKATQENAEVSGDEDEEE
jgi:translation initiation factor 2 subunit 1